MAKSGKTETTSQPPPANAMGELGSSGYYKVIPKPSAGTPAKSKSK